MAKTETRRDSIGDLHDDGLWPDFEQSAESSVHENLPSSSRDVADEIGPDYEQSIESVKDGAEVLAAHGFGKDELYPDEELSKQSAEDVARQLDEADAARSSDGDSKADEDATKDQKKATKKAAAKKPGASDD